MAGCLIQQNFILDTVQLAWHYSINSTSSNMAGQTSYKCTLDAVKTGTCHTVL